MILISLVLAAACYDNCSVEIEEDEVILFYLENCAPCERVKTRLFEYGIEYSLVNLEKYNQVVGDDRKIEYAPAIVQKKNGVIKFVL